MGSDSDLDFDELEEKELELKLRLLRLKKARLQKERQKAPKVKSEPENTPLQVSQLTSIDTKSTNTLTPVVSRETQPTSDAEAEQENLEIFDTPGPQVKSNRSSIASIHDRVLETGHNSRERRLSYKSPKSPRSPSLPKSAQSPIPTATVQWNFSARSKEELSIIAGTKLEVIDFNALQDWSLFRSPQTEQTGWAPTKYVVPDPLPLEEEEVENSDKTSAPLTRLPTSDSAEQATPLSAGNNLAGTMLVAEASHSSPVKVRIEPPLTNQGAPAIAREKAVPAIEPLDFEDSVKNPANAGLGGLNIDFLGLSPQSDLDPDQPLSLETNFLGVSPLVAENTSQIDLNSNDPKSPHIAVHPAPVDIQIVTTAEAADQDKARLHSSITYPFTDQPDAWPLGPDQDDDDGPNTPRRFSFASSAESTQPSGTRSARSRGQTSTTTIDTDHLSPSDRQLMDIAAEEMPSDIDERQLNDMHPWLREQVLQTMEHYMPDAKTPVSGSGTDLDSQIDDAPKTSTDSVNTKTTSTTDGQDRDTLTKLSASNPLAAVLSGPKALQNLWSREARATESMALTHESTETAFLEDDDEEDRCYCGKGVVGRDSCYYCWPCDGVVYCDSCWSLPPPHKDSYKRAKFTNPSNKKVVHEKSDPASARKIVEALHSDHSLEYQAMLHTADEDTTWFGTGRDSETGDTVFQDFGRYARLMAEVARVDLPPRYPALVSFVGQTGAGKSSLIRLLVELHSPAEVNPQVPVIGSTRRSDLPTSGDVHLYADMNTFYTDTPMLYADCEGLDGGEREPAGARLKSKKNLAEGPNKRTNSFARNIRRQHHTSEREILWATDTLRRSREYHVRHLYPRLLYTFSDVIVFVMKNPRVVESVIEQLLKWAADAIETSSNQPVLPHAIIVLNAYDNAADPDSWDPNQSTINLMERVSRAVHRNHNIRKFAEFWRQKGREIENVEMLLLSYYSSIRVVTVPERGRPNLINGQVQRLYHEISEACEKSRASKHKLRMLLNSDELQPYLQYAFDHFSRNLERPFDFVQASLSHSPITSNFAGNLLKLAIDTSRVWKDRLGGVHIFKELAWMAASCIMVECARRRTLGAAENMLGAYIHHWDQTLKDFCDKHWPCEYVHSSTQGRCVNVKAGHTKGHQLSNGRVLSVGDYESAFNFDKYQNFFHKYLLHILKKLVQKLSDETVSSPQLELEKAQEIHRKQILSTFFRHLHRSQNSGFISHTACYTCLMQPPEHALPCGHVLCTPCIKGYGQQRGRTLWEIQQCPQHYDDVDGQFSTNWPVYIKPPGAGVRILSLDGGGVRGIIELCFLKAIERSIGPLAIQHFLDLIVGTSTGGVIALGLGAHGWTVDKCMRTFERLCKHAFKKRRGIGIPGLEHFVTVANDSRYETEPLERALKEAFGTDHHLFAGSRADIQDQVMLQRVTKVAVVATTLAGIPTALPNYNRVDDPDTTNYQYQRSEKPSHGLKTWEAARATAAAPLFFKPYVHELSGQTYQDGCLYFNNPVRIAMREQKLIWPDRADCVPDIVLSIGTGVNEKLIRKSTPKRSRIAFFRSLQNLASMATDHIQSSLYSEQTWRDFLIDTSPPTNLRDRFERINLSMNTAPPRMDEVGELEGLKSSCASYCKKPESASHIKDIADRLIATSFYFQLVESDTTTIDGKTCVYGIIQCRLPTGQQTSSLGDVLERRVQTAYNQTRQDRWGGRPYFVVQERRRESDSRQLTVSQEVTHKMRNEGVFTFPKVEIILSDNNAETDILFCFGDRHPRAAFFPISGFPRCLPQEVDKILRPRFVQADQPNFVKVDWEALAISKKDWGSDAEGFFSSDDPLKWFGSRDYRNPGNIQDPESQHLSDRYSVYTAERPSYNSSTRWISAASAPPVPSIPPSELGDGYGDNDIFIGEGISHITEDEEWRQRWLSVYASTGYTTSISFSAHMYRNRPALYPAHALQRLQLSMYESGKPLASGQSAHRDKILGKPTPICEMPTGSPSKSNLAISSTPRKTSAPMSSISTAATVGSAPIRWPFGHSETKRSQLKER